MSEFISMATHLDIDPARVNAIVQIVIDYFNGSDTESLRQRLRDELGSITSSEFAYAAQLFAAGHAGERDQEFTERHKMIHTLFEEVIGLDAVGGLPPGHPVHTYLQENVAINMLANDMRGRLDLEFDATWWKEAYARLWEVNTHYVRQENQLFPFLEKKGFNHLTSSMRSSHDDIRVAIKESQQLLADGAFDAFLSRQRAVLDAVVDTTLQEEKILFPTSLKLLSDAEWAAIRRGEAEVGYCLIDPPPSWSPDITPTPKPISPSPTPKTSPSPAKTKAEPKPFTGLQKRNAVNIGAVGLAGGFLSPQQINLLFKNLPVDITFVDEWDQVKFYNRGDERVFPRSPGIIDREVRYCHPPKSVHMVLQIVNAFKAGERDTAEFWIQMRGRFIHIRYFAVRDEEGNYKGVLEVSQDVTHLRSLENLNE